MRLRIDHFQKMKTAREPIPCLTAYDYPTARIADEVGIPLILVGDSLANVVLGYDSTVLVTMEEMLHHVKPVVRGTERALVVADMPFMSYQVSEDDALRNAGRFLQEGDAQAVKLEGGHRSAPTVQRMTDAGIPVMGHIGLTPQSVNQLGGYKVQGSGLAAARDLLQDALELEQAGVFAVVLETVPAPLAKVITDRLRVPTIGVGAGPHCDGQILVVHDMLGFGAFRPRHAKRYAEVGEVMGNAMRSYVQEVQSHAFPDGKHSHQDLDEGVLEALLAEIGPDR
jgi:3-methyl-2-oxobutanoate hydroxymethyltransferase